MSFSDQFKTKLGTSWNALYHSSELNQQEEMNPDQVYLIQMECLTEKYIFKKLLIWMTPGFIIGSLGLFLPFFYAILQVHSVDICLCSFYYDKINNNRHYVGLT